MDKDVEVSKDQNTIVVDGTRMQSRPISPYLLSPCEECDVFRTTGNHDSCYLIPCSGMERRDLSCKIFVIVK